MAKEDNTRRKFFELSAKYQLPDDADWQDLADDALCLLDSGLAQLSSLAEELGGLDPVSNYHQRLVFSAMYLIQMGRNAAGGSYERVHGESGVAKQGSGSTLV